MPEALGTLRQIWSDRGTRVGLSSISRTHCFWFITLNCPEVPAGKALVVVNCTQGLTCMVPAPTWSIPLICHCSIITYSLSMLSIKLPYMAYH